MPRRKSTDKAQVGLRLPERLRKQVEAEARKYGRSLNAEIVRRLERSFEPTAEFSARWFAPKLVVAQFNKLFEALGHTDLVVTEDQLRAQIADAENQSAPIAATDETGLRSGDQSEKVSTDK